MKAMRTQSDASATKHLSNGRTMSRHHVEVSRRLDSGQVDALIVARDDEELGLLILGRLMGG